MFSFLPTLIALAYLISFLFKNYHSAIHIFPAMMALNFLLPYLLIYLFTVYIYDDPKEKSKSEAA